MNIALAIILHPTEKVVLIALRKSDVHLPDLWEFPGGKCLPGETLEQCALRETYEEVRLTVEILEAWPPITYAYSERTVTLHPFLCRAQNADARPLGNRQIAWVAPSDLGDYTFPEANASLLKRLQSIALLQ